MQPQSDSKKDKRDIGSQGFSFFGNIARTAHWLQK